MTCGRPITSRSVESWTESYHSTNPALFPTASTLFSCKCFRGEIEEKSATILTIGISPYLRCNANVPSTFLPPPPQPQPNPLSPSVSSLPDSPRLFCTAQQLVIRLVSLSLFLSLSLSLSLSPSLHFYLSLLASLSLLQSRVHCRLRNSLPLVAEACNHKLALTPLLNRVDIHCLPFHFPVLQFLPFICAFTLFAVQMYFPAIAFSVFHLGSINFYHSFLTTSPS